MIVKLISKVVQSEAGKDRERAGQKGSTLPEDQTTVSGALAAIPY